MLADPRQSGIDALLRKIYEIYSDFALKNPFYSLEMPIRYGLMPCAARQPPPHPRISKPLHFGCYLP